MGFTAEQARRFLDESIGDGLPEGEDLHSRYGSLSSAFDQDDKPNEEYIGFLDKISDPNANFNYDPKQVARDYAMFEAAKKLVSRNQKQQEAALAEDPKAQKEMDEQEELLATQNDPARNDAIMNSRDPLKTLSELQQLKAKLKDESPEVRARIFQEFYDKTGLMKSGDLPGSLTGEQQGEAPVITGASRNDYIMGSKNPQKALAEIQKVENQTKNESPEIQQQFLQRLYAGEFDEENESQQETDPWVEASYMPTPASYLQSIAERGAESLALNTARQADLLGAVEMEALTTPEQVAREREFGSLAFDPDHDPEYQAAKEVTEADRQEASRRNKESFVIKGLQNVRAKADAFVAEHPEWEQNQIELSWDTAFDPSYLAQTIGMIAPSIFGAISSGMIGAAVTGGNPAGAVAGATGYTYLLEAGMFYSEAVDAGMDPVEARKIARMVGGVNAAMEMLPMNKLFNTHGFKKLFNRRLATSLAEKDITNITTKEALSQAVTESLTEVGQEITTIIGEIKGYRDDITLEEVEKRLVESGYGGLIGGPTTVVGGAVVSNIKSGVKKTPGIGERESLDLGFTPDTDIAPPTTPETVKVGETIPEKNELTHEDFVLSEIADNFAKTQAEKPAFQEIDDSEPAPETLNDIQKQLHEQNNQLKSLVTDKKIEIARLEEALEYEQEITNNEDGIDEAETGLREAISELNEIQVLKDDVVNNITHNNQVLNTAEQKRKPARTKKRAIPQEPSQEDSKPASIEAIQGVEGDEVAPLSTPTPVNKLLYRGAAQDGIENKFGTWATPDKGAAQEYADLHEGGTVTRVETQIKNVAEPEDVRSIAEGLGLDVSKEADYWLVTPEQSENAEPILEELIKRGYDAVHMPQGEDFAPSGKAIESYLILRKGVADERIETTEAIVKPVEAIEVEKPKFSDLTKEDQDKEVATFIEAYDKENGSGGAYEATKKYGISLVRADKIEKGQPVASEEEFRSKMNKIVTEKVDKLNTEPRKQDKVGTKRNVAGDPAELTRIETDEANVSYEYWEGEKAYIRVYDVDTGKSISINTYPDKAKGLAAYDKAIEDAGITTQADKKPVVSRETPKELKQKQVEPLKVEKKSPKGGTIDWREESIEGLMDKYGAIQKKTKTPYLYVTYDPSSNKEDRRRAIVENDGIRIDKIVPTENGDIKGFVLGPHSAFYSVDEVELSSHSRKRLDNANEKIGLGDEYKELGLSAEDEASLRKQVGQATKFFGSRALDLYELGGIDQDLVSKHVPQGYLGDSRADEILRKATALAAFEQFGYDGDFENKIDKGRAYGDLLKRLEEAKQSPKATDTVTAYETIEQLSEEELKAGGMTDAELEEIAKTAAEYDRQAEEAESDILETFAPEIDAIKDQDTRERSTAKEDRDLEQLKSEITALEARIAKGDESVKSEIQSGLFPSGADQDQLFNTTDMSLNSISKIRAELEDKRNQLAELKAEDKTKAEVEAGKSTGELELEPKKQLTKPVKAKKELKKDYATTIAAAYVKAELAESNDGATIVRNYANTFIKPLAGRINNAPWKAGKKYAEWRKETPSRELAKLIKHGLIQNAFDADGNSYYAPLTAKRPADLMSKDEVDKVMVVFNRDGEKAYRALLSKEYSHVRGVTKEASREDLAQAEWTREKVIAALKADTPIPEAVTNKFPSLVAQYQYQLDIDKTKKDIANEEAYIRNLSEELPKPLRDVKRAVGVAEINDAITLAQTQDPDKTYNSFDIEKLHGTYVQAVQNLTLLNDKLKTLSERQRQVIAQDKKLEKAPPLKLETEEVKSISDLGDKIGGARKDLSTGRSLKKKTAAKPKGWRSRYNISQIAAESSFAGGITRESPNVGKFAIFDKRKKKTTWSGIPRPIGNKYFDTEEEANEMMPLLAVAEKHRVYGTLDKFTIYRSVTDRKRVRVLKQEFDTREDAMKYMATHAEELLDTKLTFGEEILPRPDVVFRNGEERRKGNVTGESFMDTFGFRGVEFGNWVTKTEERQEVMNHAFDALLDMAEVLGIPAKAVSLNGDLALAFGARGQGLSGAAAHYEPSFAVINLTKMAGAGHLAHEWFHALDHYVGRLDTKAGGRKAGAQPGKPIFEGKSDRDIFATHGFQYASRSKARPELREAFDEFVKTMFTKGQQYVEDTQKADKFLEAARDGLDQNLKSIRDYISTQRESTYYKRNNAPATPEQLAEFDKLAKMLLDGESLETQWMNIEGSRSRLKGRWSNDVLESISKIYKAVRGRTGISEGTGDNLIGRLKGPMEAYQQRIKIMKDAEGGTKKLRRVPTDFRKQATAADQAKSSAYWATEHEMGARAFAAYIEDKLAEKENVNDFLAFHAHGAVIVPIYPEGLFRPYPEGAERKAINKAFEKLFDTIETKESESGIEMFQKDSPMERATPEWNESAIAIMQGVFAGAKVVKTKQGWAEATARLGKSPKSAFGFWDPKTETVYINPDKSNKDTVFHEFTHPVIEQMRLNDPELYAKGMELIAGTGYVKNAIAQDYVNPMNEALVQAIGERGASIQDQAQRNKFIAWVEELWTKVKAQFKKTFGLDMTLDDFVNNVAYGMRNGAIQVKAQNPVPMGRSERRAKYGRNIPKDPITYVAEDIDNSVGGVQIGMEFSDDVQPLAEPRVRVGLTQTGVFKSSIDRVNNISDAGRLAQDFIGNRAQENIIAIVMGDSGEVLKVIKHTTGGQDASQVFPSSVIGSILNVDGVKSVWFSHNHPSGEYKASKDDIVVTAKFRDMLSLTDIKMNGHFIVTPKNTGLLDIETKDQIDLPKIDNKKSNKKSFEREIEYGDLDGVQKIDGQSKALPLIQRMKAKTGLLLLNTQYQPIGELEITPEEMAQLRDNKAHPASRFYKAIERTNTKAVIIKANRIDVVAATNLAKFINSATAEASDYQSHLQERQYHDVAVLDIMDNSGSWPSGTRIAELTGPFNQEDPEPGDIFYSTLTQAVEGMKQNKAPADQWMAVIRKQPGVKKEEIESSGLEVWLNEQKGSIPREDIVNFLKANEITVTETELGGKAPANVEWEDLTEPMQEIVSMYENRTLSGGEFMDSATKEGFNVALNNGAYTISKGKVPAPTPTKFANYTTSGGKNYRELLLTLPEAPISEDYNNVSMEIFGEKYSGLSIAERQRVDNEVGFKETPAPFRSSHFDQPNILAHIRFDERIDAQGRRVLHIAEVQSDWHQAGRKKGYATGARDFSGLNAKIENGLWNVYTADGDFVSTVSRKRATTAEEAIAKAQKRIDDGMVRLKNKGVPDAPFKTTWPLLAMKRMMRYAAENNFDAITWDTGEIQADRYDLSKQVDAIEFSKNNDGTYFVRALKDDKNLFERDRLDESGVEELIGKDATEKVISREDGSLTGLDLSVGGEGMKAFYDAILPSTLNKYVKKMGGRVGQSTIPFTEANVYINDARAVKNEGDNGWRVETFSEDKGAWTPFYAANVGVSKSIAESVAAKQRDIAKKSKTGIEVPQLIITPQMKQMALSGQPQFQVDPKRTLTRPSLKDLTSPARELVRPKRAKRVLAKHEPGEREVKRVKQLTRSLPEQGKNVLVKKRTATLIKDQIRFLKRGAQLGAKDKAEALEKLKKLIRDYATEKLPKQVSRGQITPLLTEMAQAKTLKQVQKSYNRIDDIFKTSEYNRLRSTIREKIKDYQPGKRSGKTVGTRLSPDEYKTVAQIKDLLEIDRAAAIETVIKINDLADGAGREFTLSEKDEIYMTMKFGGIDGMSNAELGYALKDINQLIDFGKIKRREEMAKQKFGRDASAEMIVNVVTGGKGVLGDMEYRGSNLEKDGFFKFLRKWDDSLQGLESITDKLSNDKSAPNKSGFTEYVMRRVSKARNAEASGTARIEETLTNKLAEIYGEKNIESSLNDNKKVIDTGVYIEEGEKTVEIKLSQNEIYKKLLEWEMPSAASGFETMGWTQETIDELSEVLDPKVREWAEWQITEFYPSYYEGINDVYRKVYGVDLGFDEFYTPLYRDVKGQREDDLLDGNKSAFSSVANGHLKAKIPNSRKIQFVDGDVVLMRHIVEMEHFKAYAEVMGDLRSVVQRESVQAAIEQYGGKRANRIINGFLDDLARGGIDKGKAIASLDYIRRMFVRSKLGLNPVTTYKQLASIPAYTEGMPVLEWMKGISRIPLEYNEMLEILGHSEFLKARYRKGWERDVAASIARSTPKALAGSSNLTDKLLFLTKLGDKAAIVVGGWPLYQYVYKQSLASGMVEDQARAEAMYQFEQATDRAQQSSNTEALADFMRQGSLAKAMTMFQTTQNQYYRIEVGAIRNLRKGRGKPSENIKRFMLAHFFLPMIFQFIASGFRWDDEDQLRAAILGSFNGLLAVGQIIESAIQAMFDGRWYGEDMSPIADTFNTLGEGVVKTARLVKGEKTIFDEDGNITEYAVGIIDDYTNTAADLTGLPYGQAKRQYSNLSDIATGETDHPVRRALGFSSYSIDKKIQDDLKDDLADKYGIISPVTSKKNTAGFQKMSREERKSYLSGYAESTQETINKRVTGFDSSTSTSGTRRLTRPSRK